MRRTLLCSLVLIMLTCGRAFAHARLEASEPRAGAVVAHAPPQLRLRFNEVVRRPGTGVELVIRIEGCLRPFCYWHIPDGLPIH